MNKHTSRDILLQKTQKAHHYITEHLRILLEGVKDLVAVQNIGQKGRSEVQAESVYFRGFLASSWLISR